MNLPVKVLLVGPALNCRGGVQNYNQLLLNHMDNQSVNYYYLEIGKKSDQSPFWMRPLEYISDICKFMFQLIDFEPQIIHFSPSLNWRSLPLNLILIMISKSLRKIPILIFFHGWTEAIALSMQKKTISGRLLKAVLFLADHYIVLGSIFREEMKNSGFPLAKISIASVMVELTSINQTIARVSQLNADKQNFRVLFLSRLIPSKGTKSLCSAIHWWQINHPEFPVIFTIVGEGPEMTFLCENLKAEIDSHSVELLGFLEGAEKWEIFCQSDLFLFPSIHHEGFPTVIVEAFAAGLPIIYTPVGALREILDEKNGVRMELNELSDENIGKAIHYLLKNASKRELISKTNQSQASRFDVKIVCSKILETYFYLLDQTLTIT